MRIIVARHCETDWNARGRIQGITDIELNDTGREQARRLGERLVGLGIVAIVCSDLKRAVETAEIVAAAIGAPVIRDARLRECAFGTLDGVSHAMFALRCGLKNLPTARDPLLADFTAFGGDRCRDLFDRQKQLLDELAPRHGDGTVMIVGHGRSLRTLLVPLGHGHRFYTQGDFVIIEYP